MKPKRRKIVLEEINIFQSEISFQQTYSDKSVAGQSYMFADLLAQDHPDQRFLKALRHVEKTVTKWWKEYKRAEKIESKRTEE